MKIFIFSLPKPITLFSSRAPLLVSCSGHLLPHTTCPLCPTLYKIYACLLVLPNDCSPITKSHIPPSTLPNTHLFISISPLFAVTTFLYYHYQTVAALHCALSLIVNFPSILDSALDLGFRNLICLY